MKIPPFAIERYFARYEFSVEHLLCCSDCESMSTEDLLSFEPEARERLLSQRLGYTESRGGPSLRREICGLYRLVDEDHVLVLTGAEEAIFLFMHAVLGRGDHVIVPRPCYQSLLEVAKSIGCRVTPWNAHEEEGWAFDVDELRRLIRPDTRVIVVNTPHNPTGSLMTLESFRELNGIAEERGIILFSDEVYRESEHDPADRLPAAADMSLLAVSLGVMSKTYGLPGLRVGWVAARNTDVLEKMAALKDYTTICGSAPGELLAEVALRHREALVKRSVGIITKNLSIVDGFFKRHAEGFSWRRPKAGPIAFPRMLNGNVENFCEKLVQHAGVLLLPGTVFGDRTGHFRIGFGRASLPAAIDRLDEFLGGHMAVG